MRALCWTGIDKLSVETVSDPGVINPHDAIVKVTLSSLCGSDLHLISGFVSGVRRGDILGHEFVGEIVEIGSSVSKLRIGDRVVVSPVIACGSCTYCNAGAWSLCDNSNPSPEFLEKEFGAITPGIIGFPRAYGGYSGSHAEYVRVPFADAGAFVIPEDVTNEQAVFISDAFPTGYMAADFADIRPGDTVAVWGCGAVGLMAIHSALLLGAGRVIAIDRFPQRLKAASEKAGADTLNYEETDIREALNEITGGRGPDRCIDAVGMDAHSPTWLYAFRKLKHSFRSDPGASFVLDAAIKSCRNGGTVAIVGLYQNSIDKFPVGAAISKGLTIKMGLAQAQRYVPVLLDHVKARRVDPSYLLTHKLPLDQGPEGYQIFKKRRDECLRVVFDPCEVVRTF